MTVTTDKQTVYVDKVYTTDRSAAIRTVAYDQENQILWIMYHSHNDAYGYKGFTALQFNALIASDSLGSSARVLVSGHPSAVYVQNAEFALKPTGEGALEVEEDTEPTKVEDLVSKVEDVYDALDNLFASIADVLGEINGL